MAEIEGRVRADETCITDSVKRRKKSKRKDVKKIAKLKSKEKHYKQKAKFSKKFYREMYRRKSAEFERDFALETLQATNKDLHYLGKLFAESIAGKRLDAEGFIVLERIQRGGKKDDPQS